MHPTLDLDCSRERFGWIHFGNILLENEMDKRSAKIVGLTIVRASIQLVPTCWADMVLKTDKSLVGDIYLSNNVGCLVGLTTVSAAL
jgi:hypothetical protein